MNGIDGKKRQVIDIKHFDLKPMACINLFRQRKRETPGLIHNVIPYPPSRSFLLPNAKSKKPPSHWIIQKIAWKSQRRFYKTCTENSSKHELAKKNKTERNN